MGLLCSLPAGPNRILRYVIDFTLPAVTVEDSGPVTLSFYVNDHLLDRVRYTESGTTHFEEPAPPDWVQEYEEVTVAAEIDKLWISKEDGQRLGFYPDRRRA
jgi:hypothetical protein